MTHSRTVSVFTLRACPSPSSTSSDSTRALFQRAASVLMLPKAVLMTEVEKVELHCQFSKL